MPLSWVVGSSHTAVVRLLLTIDQVDMDSKSSSSFDKGWSPLSYLAKGEHKTIVSVTALSGPQRTESMGS